MRFAFALFLLIAVVLASTACDGSATGSPSAPLVVSEPVKALTQQEPMPSPEPPGAPPADPSPRAPDPSPDPVPATTPATAEPVYRVQPGDTLHGIAARTGTSVTALVTANGLRGSRAEPGRDLLLPAPDLRPPLPPEGPVGSAAVIDLGVTTRRSVALTFDAGADRGYAELILNVLHERGVRASFGMTGVWASANPDLVQRMADEGHRFINHSWDHGSFTGFSPRTRPLSQAQRWAQLDQTEALLRELTGLSTRPFFRSPYGDLDASVQRDIAARGYAYNVLWTVDSGGWTGLRAAGIIERCLRSARPGAIYLMHVGAAAADGPALAAIIDGLAAAGYDFETIDEIIAR